MSEKNYSQHHTVLGSEPTSRAASVKNLDPNFAASTHSFESRTAAEAPSPKTGVDTPADDDVLIIDWDGPDDPENPKKYVCTLFILFYPI